MVRVRVRVRVRVNPVASPVFQQHLRRRDERARLVPQGPRAQVEAVGIRVPAAKQRGEERRAAFKCRP